jgi:hypothetical protein
MRSPSGWISSNGKLLAGIPETSSDLFRKENSNKAEIISTFIFVCLFSFAPLRELFEPFTFQIFVLVLYFGIWSVFVKQVRVVKLYIIFIVVCADICIISQVASWSLA